MSFLNANRAMLSMWGRMVKADKGLLGAYRDVRGTDVGQMLGRASAFPGRRSSAVGGIAQRMGEDMANHRTGTLIGMGVGALAGGAAGSQAGDGVLGTSAGIAGGAALGMLGGAVAGSTFHAGSLGRNLGSYAYQGSKARYAAGAAAAGDKASWYSRAYGGARGIFSR